MRSSRSAFILASALAAASAAAGSAQAATPFGAPVGQVGVSSSPVTVATGDLNRDGNLDAVVAAPGKLDILLGNGHDGWADHRVLDGISSPTAMALTDIDGNGSLDIVEVNGSGQLLVSLGNGSGGIATATTYPIAGSATGVAPGDFNGDGMPDIAVSTSGSVIGTLLNNGSGGLGAESNSTLTLPAGALASTTIADTRAITTGDFDQDGTIDIAAVRPSSGAGLTLMWGHGDGTFDAPQTNNLSGAIGPLVPAAMTSDGKLSLVSIRSGGSVTGQVYRPNGGGTHVPNVAGGSIAPSGKTASTLAVGDADGDGKADVVGGFVGTNTFFWTPGTGAGVPAFTASGIQQITLDSPVTAVAMGDFDNDGRQDAVIVQPSNNARIVPNSGGAASTASSALISELRLSGPGGSGDQYVQLYNRSLTSTLDLGGWTLRASNGATVTIPQGTVLPTGGHLLLTRPRATAGGFSLFGSASPDAQLPYGANGSLALTGSAGGYALVNSAGITVDAAGFSGAPSGYSEGTSITPVGAIGQLTYVRKFVGGAPQDTGNNAADFVAVDTGANGTTSALLGAPRPDGAAAPTIHSDFLQSSLVSGTDQAASPNQVLSPSTGPPTSVTINRTITNCSGSAAGNGVCKNSVAPLTAKTVTRLRFRITALTTYGSPGAGAILKAVASSDAAPGGISVRGLPLDSPSPSGRGGVNSTLTATALLPPAGLKSGESINVSFTFEIVRSGKFNFAFNTEDDLVDDLEPAAGAPAAAETTPAPSAIAELPPTGAAVPDEISGTIPAAVAPVPSAAVPVRAVPAAARACVNARSAVKSKSNVKSTSKSAKVKRALGKVRCMPKKSVKAKPKSKTPKRGHAKSAVKRK